MKTVLNAIYELLLSLGQAKAASALARAGQHEAAKEMMTK